MSGDINVQTFSGKVNISNNLKVGSGHLFVDTVNNQVGLNTNDPQANLHVNGNTYVHTNFRVGSGIIMNETSGRITAGSFVGDGSALQGINSDSGSWVNGASSNVHLATTGDSVGIGVVDPQYKLDVAGDINITSGSTLRVGGTPAVFSNWTVNGDDISRSSGNVGIGGSASATNKLKVTGTIESTTGFAGIQASDVPTLSAYATTSALSDGLATKQASGDYAALAGSTSQAFSVSTLTTNGDVGIGTTDPTELLDITAASGTDAFIRLRCSGGDTGESGLKLTESGEYGFQFTHSAVTDLLKIKHQNSAGAVDLDDIMVWNPNGNVGIGTTDPISIFHTHGGELWDGSSMASKVCATLSVARGGGAGGSASTQDAGTGAILKFTHDGTLYRHVTMESVSEGAYSNQIGIRFKTVGSNSGPLERMRIMGSGNVGIGTTSPSSKLTVNQIPEHRSSYDHSLAPMTITNRTVTSNTTLNDPQHVLNLAREGTSGEAHGARATFKLSRWENSGTGSRTRLDLNLAHDSYNETDIMTFRSDGNVGIGTTSPEGGLHVYGKTLILGQIASVPSGPDGTMYYNSTTNQPLVKVNGSWISLVNFLPSNISGLVGWYLPENWTGSQWTDASTAGNHVTAYEGTINYTASHSGSSVGASATFPVIYGNTAAELNFPSAILPSTYTLISMTRYNGSTKGRILDGQNGNWLSGHWSGSSGVAYHNGWLTTQTNRHGSNWVIGVDQNSLYRSKSQSVAWTNDTGGGGSSTNLRLGSVGYEASEWMCAELIVYNRTLSSDEYTQLADYIQNKYGIY